ncbi:hypothetical protein Tco_0964358 [Tanacetum coccineum]
MLGARELITNPTAARAAIWVEAWDNENWPIVDSVVGGGGPGGPGGGGPRGGGGGDLRGGIGDGRRDSRGRRYGPGSGSKGGKFEFTSSVGRKSNAIFALPGHGSTSSVGRKSNAIFALPDHRSMSSVGRKSNAIFGRKLKIDMAAYGWKVRTSPRRVKSTNTDTKMTKHESSDVVEDIEPILMITKHSDGTNKHYLDTNGTVHERLMKKPNVDVRLHEGFFDPIIRDKQVPSIGNGFWVNEKKEVVSSLSKQFWVAGDDESCGNSDMVIPPANAARNPHDRAFEASQRSSKWKNYTGDKLWKQALLAKRALFEELPVDSSNETNGLHV